MTTAPHLLNEDRPDFERILDDALRIVLEDAEDGGTQRPTGATGTGMPLNAEQLRTLALAAAEPISGRAAAEYDAYRTIRARTREAVRESARTRDSSTFGYAAMGVADGAGSGAGLAAVIAVLTPLLAGAAAVIFLLIGYSMAAVHPQPAIASPLRTAGWFFAAIAAAAIVLGGIGLLLTALRDGSGAIHDTPDGMPPEVLQARAAWHRALLDRGLLPFLDDALNDTAAPAAPAPAPSAPRMPRLGYSRPDFSSPQDQQPRRNAPRFSSPDFSSPDFGSPDFGGPDHAPE